MAMLLVVFLAEAVLQLWECEWEFVIAFIFRAVKAAMGIIVIISS